MIARAGGGIIAAMRHLLTKWIVLGAVVSLPFAASAADKDKEKKDDKSSATPKPPPVSAYDQAIQDANKAFAAGLAGNQIDDAIAAYRKAIAIDPARPEGHLYLGGALYQKGDFVGAEEAASTAETRAKADKQYKNFEGKAIFLLATVQEAQEKPLEAKKTWQRYADFAKANPDQDYPPGAGPNPPMLLKVYPATALDRDTKIEGYAKMYDEYAKVRDLIEKRQKELGIPSAASATKVPK